MKILGYLIQKEFLQIFRNRALLPMMTILPIVQLLLLSNAASNEVKNINIVLVDNDYSAQSRLLARKVVANDRFSLVAVTNSDAEANGYMQANETDIILKIPINFEREYLRGNAQNFKCSSTPLTDNRLR